MIVDTHAHIYEENYDNIEEIIKSAKENGVVKIINCGESLKTSKEVISLYKKHNDIFECAIGIHPEYASENLEKDLLILEKLIKTEKIVAVGEIGLDFHYEIDNKEQQIKLFETQLNFATKYKLPVIIHSRDATEETLKILKKYNLKGIMHCFSGSLETAKEYIKLGYLLGIGGIVTFKNCKLIEIIQKIGIENIVFETDSPYLTPEPFRKYKNEPKHVTETANFVAKKMNINYEKITNISNEKIRHFFDINI